MNTHIDSTAAAKRSQLLKVTDMAQLLNVKPRTIYEMVAQDRIPYRNPRGSDILRFDLDEYWNGRAEKTNDLKDRCCYHPPRSLGGCNLMENNGCLFTNVEKARTGIYYFRVRGVRYRGSIPEARTKQKAEQAESKIKQEAFEKRFDLEQKGTDPRTADRETFL